MDNKLIINTVSWHNMLGTIVKSAIGTGRIVSKQVQQLLNRPVVRNGRNRFATCPVHSPQSRHSARMLTHGGLRDCHICIGFTTPQVSCSQYGNRTPTHDLLNCFYTLLALPQTLACALWRSAPGLRRCGPVNVLCTTQCMSCAQLSIFRCIC